MVLITHNDWVLTTVYAKCSGNLLTRMITFNSHYPCGRYHLLTCRNLLIIGKLRFKTNSCFKHLCYLSCTQYIITITGSSIVLKIINIQQIPMEIISFFEHRLIKWPEFSAEMSGLLRSLPTSAHDRKTDPESQGTVFTIQRLNRTLPLPSVE